MVIMTWHYIFYWKHKLDNSDCGLRLFKEAWNGILQQNRAFLALLLMLFMSNNISKSKTGLYSKTYSMMQTLSSREKPICSFLQWIETKNNKAWHIKLLMTDKISFCNNHFIKHCIHLFILTTKHLLHFWVWLMDA